MLIDICGMSPAGRLFVTAMFGIGSIVTVCAIGLVVLFCTSYFFSRGQSAQVTRRRPW